MARNPLDDGNAPTQSGRMRMGDVRTVIRPDGTGITIRRTKRDYVHDLCDAYNARLSESRKDIEWSVNQSGGLYLRDKDEWSSQHTNDLDLAYRQDREWWKRGQGMA